MLPGFQDAHIHPIYSGLDALACDLSQSESVEGYRAIIPACAEARADKEWITGGGWSMAAFGPGAMANKDILDELVPDQPAYFTSRDGHSGWANSKALEVAGITRDTPDPVDGYVDRDLETGEAIGSLQEGAMRLVTHPRPWMNVLPRSSTHATCFTATALRLCKRPMPTRQTWKPTRRSTSSTS
jgi:predicted amidohydrolase YtcJ